MGLLEKIFPRHGEAEKVEGYFKTLTAYTPVFTTFEQIPVEYMDNFSCFCESHFKAEARNRRFTQ